MAYISGLLVYGQQGKRNARTSYQLLECLGCYRFIHAYRGFPTYCWTHPTVAPSTQNISSWLHPLIKP